MAYVTMINEKDTDVSQDDDCTGDTEGDVMTLHRKDDTDEESNEGEESEDEASDLRERSIRNCIRSRPCSICVYLTLSLVILASVVSLIVIGVLIVAPYKKASTFLDTKCESVTLEVEPEARRCSCGKGCNSKYPCIRVTVRTEQMGGVFSMDHVVMYENEATLLRHVSPKCSYYPPCKSSKMANEKAVRDYEHMYGQPGKKFTCLYNPKNPTEVIRTRRFHLNHVIHGMVWSSLVFILSLVILIVAIRKKGCDFL